MKHNHISMKAGNKRNLIELLITTGPKTRANLARESGLAPSAVTRLIRELMEDGIVSVIQFEEKNEPGRKGEVLSLSEKPVAAVFDIGVTKTSLGIAFLNGKIDVVSHFKTPRSVEEFFNFALEKVNTMRNVYNFDIVSFSVPGIVNCETKEIILAPNLEWYNVKITELFSGDFEILADNEANLSMMAEARYATDLLNVENAVFVIVREGVGTGVMIDGKVVRGNNFSAGEFGHMIVSIDSQQLCHCGNKGCWELFASIRWANQRYGLLNGNNHIDKFEELLSLTKQGDEKAKSVLMEHAYNVAIGIVNIVNGVNPEVVIIGGSLSSAPDWYFSKVEEIVKERALKMAVKDLKIRPTIFTEPSSNLVGAAVYAIERYLDKVVSYSVS
ncbi:ROK family transcriptional regulator [Pseudothermotoga thermarum]|uniref:ROK family protein n=1 Tax=Pseudothermotoga thermarum DSM 5069 TaxID=688269 RepID=F7YUQ6_9THEM|nr:ROK family transcriptional regulator [Pseudothermotoga thermarum]AEH50241.1 ROK family protein [Pseudothermotoga thermarum DSM 5069]